MDIQEQVKICMRTPQSEISLQRKLRENGCSAQETADAVRWLHGDWRRQALALAGHLAQTAPPISRLEIRDALKSRGFLPGETDFALTALPVSWFDRARAAVIPEGEDKAEYLHAREYTDDEIVWALEEIQTDEEDAAWQRALFLLSGGPYSRTVFQILLTENMEDGLAASVLARLGNIWEEQARTAALRLLGRYGALLSEKRLLQFLQAQKYTLDEIAAVLADFSADWEEQALQCALYYYRTKHLPVRSLKGALRENLFTAQEIRSALAQLTALEKIF